MNFVLLLQPTKKGYFLLPVVRKCPPHKFQILFEEGPCFSVKQGQNAHFATKCPPPPDRTTVLRGPLKWVCFLCSVHVCALIQKFQPVVPATCGGLLSDTILSISCIRLSHPSHSWSCKHSVRLKLNVFAQRLYELNLIAASATASLLHA